VRQFPLRGKCLGVGAALALVALALAAPQLGAAPSALPRSEVDRADDRTGPQIHALYVVASDGADQGLDTHGTVAASVANWREARGSPA
jgi:hypothetical protein